MKTRVLIIIGIVLIFVFVTPYSFASHGNADLILTWSQANYGITNGTGIATIIVNDSDKNEISFFVEEVKVFAYSDSFAEGITLTLYETEKNSGTFERTFSFSDSRSAPNILLVSEGDTATVIYTDNPLPADYLYQTIDFTATTLIGSTGPPLERVPASNARITDIQGNVLDIAVVDEQALLTSDIANQMTRNQTFAWIVQVTDSNKKVQALSWIEGTLNPEESFSPTTSWIPKKEGYYNVVFFVWESIENPTALSPPKSTDIIVKTPIQRDPPPGPSDFYKKLEKAEEKIRTLYYQDASLGPYHIKDAIVGFGIKDRVLEINVFTKYYQPEELDFLKEKIKDIVNDDIPIKFIQAYAFIPKNISTIFPYVWNSYLQQNQIDFSPKEGSYWNHAEGFDTQKENKVCSPLIASNGTEFYISSLFLYEPFVITDTAITQSMPNDCQKIWKTDILLVEPDNILRLWLEGYWREK